MAAPSSKSIRDLNGIWLLNKTLSGDLNGLLRLQGISWLLRRAILASRILLHTSHHVGEGSPTIVIDNIAPGGIKGTTERRVLDGVQREHSDYIWGRVRGSCKLEPTRIVRDELNQEWSSETSKGECIVDETSAVDGSWSSVMVWGFEIINDMRYLVRHVTVSRENESLSEKLVYEYCGPLS